MHVVNKKPTFCNVGFKIIVRNRHQDIQACLHPQDVGEYVYSLSLVSSAF